MSLRRIVFLLSVSVFAVLASGQITSSVRTTPYTRGLLYPCVDEAAVKTYLNLESGVDFQAYSANLDTYAGIAPSADVQTFLGYADFDAMQTGLAIDDLVTLSGVAEGAADLGTFTGATITNNSTIKTALQELETAVEGAGSMGLLLAGFDARNAEPPAANFATLDAHNCIPVLDFDAGTDESMVFASVLPPGYGGGGVTVTIGWMSPDQTAGACVWGVSFMSVTDDADDIDVKAFAAANCVTATTASAAGEVDYAAISFTDGADMDSVAAGEWFRLEIERDADNGSDNMTGDAELVFVRIVEN